MDDAFVTEVIIECLQETGGWLVLDSSAATIRDRVAGAAVEALEVIEAQVRANHFLYHIR